MALKELILENFRGRTLTIQFSPQGNLVTGQNEAGKTTIREGICFAFTGMDSVGNRKPKHLISQGQEALKTTLTTDRASFIRTLTDKGNGSLKLIRDGVPSTLTQSQLEGMLGSSDLFLSAFIPGYFLDLPIERQHAVLAEVQPKIDRLALLEEIAGIQLTSDEKIRYNPTARRPDVVATYVAADRREIENTLSRLTGEQGSLEAAGVPPQPQEPLEKSRLGRLAALKQHWDRYTADLDRAQELEAQAARVRERNAERVKRRRALEGELALLKEGVVPLDPGFDANLDFLRPQLKGAPSKPALGTIVESDHCPTCGQTVGLKHREGVKSKNEETMACWEKAQQAMLEHNQKIQDQIKEVQSNRTLFLNTCKKIEDENRQIRSQKHALSLELERLREEPVPESVLVQEETPKETYNPEEYARCEQVVTEYNRQVTEYDYAVRQKTKAEGRLAEIKAQQERLGNQSARLYHLEKALKNLPGEEAKRAVGLDILGLEVQVGERIEVTRNGVPYPLLSRGTKSKTDLQLCFKLGSLMKVPLRMVFLDDADLVDELSFPPGMQWFAAKVIPGQKEVAVHAG